MIEIVHDIAPGAQIWFAYDGTGTPSGGTSLDFDAAVNCLAAHVDVVVDDVGFFNVGPYDGTSFVSANTSNALSNPANPIRGYYTSVGNNAITHYEEPYVSSGTTITGAGNHSWVLHGFQHTSATSDGGAGLTCPTGSLFCGNTVSVSPGGIFAIALSWNDASGGSTNDYDLLFVDGYDDSLYVASANRQSGTGSNPAELFAFQNTHATTTNYYVMIGNYKGLAAPRTLNMFLDCYGCLPITNGQLFNFDTVGGSVANNADAGGGVISLGVVKAYSSNGPTADGRLKPEVTAVDGVSVSGAGGFATPFYGTSAASPHAAGIAALLLGCDPALLASSGNDPIASRQTLHDALINSATVIQGPSPNNADGYGQLDAWSATAPARCNPMITTIAGNGTGGSSGDGGDPLNAELHDPEGVAADARGNVYIADTYNCRVREVSGGIIRTIAGTGTCGYNGDNQLATQAQLKQPTSVLIDDVGGLFITDSGNCRVREVTAGTISTVAGTGTCGYNGPSGAATSTDLYGPTALALDSAGNLYFADTGNCRIRKLAGSTLTTVAGVGTGSFAGCGYAGDGGAATSAQLFNPQGVAVDSAGDVYIADSTNCRVREVSADTATITTVLGGAPCGAGFGATSGPALSAQLYYPRDLAIDPAGRVIVADSGYYRVLEFHNGAFSTVAGGFAIPYGSGDGGLPTEAGLNWPYGIGLDPFGNLYIADTYDHRVRMVSAVDKDNDGEPIGSRRGPAPSCLRRTRVRARFRPIRTRTVAATAAS